MNISSTRLFLTLAFLATSALATDNSASASATNEAESSNGNGAPLKISARNYSGFTPPGVPLSATRDPVDAKAPTPTPRSAKVVVAQTIRKSAGTRDPLARQPLATPAAHPSRTAKFAPPAGRPRDPEVLERRR